MDLFFGLLALVVLALSLAPYLASTYLLVTSAKDLVAACRLLAARSRVSTFPMVAVAVSVGAGLLGLCWNFQSLLCTAAIWLYVLMAIYTFLCLPIGMLIARNNGGWLLILFLIPVTVMMHGFWGIDDPAAARTQEIMFMKNLAILGGALLLAHFGGGPFSVDQRAQPGRTPPL